MCLCPQGYIGDPFTGCSVQAQNEILTPCTPSPCGSNAICREQDKVGSCICSEGYFGNPYEGCRPECVSDSDCPGNRACTGNKCQDPCPGTCGLNAECTTVNHSPTCYCFPGYTGDAFRRCNPITCKYFFMMYTILSTRYIVSKKVRFTNSMKLCSLHVLPIFQYNNQAP